MDENNGCSSIQILIPSPEFRACVARSKKAAPFFPLLLGVENCFLLLLEYAVSMLCVEIACDLYSVSLDLPGGSKETLYKSQAIIPIYIQKYDFQL